MTATTMQTTASQAAFNNWAEGYDATYGVTSGQQAVLAAYGGIEQKAYDTSALSTSMAQMDEAFSAAAPISWQDRELAKLRQVMDPNWRDPAVDAQFGAITYDSSLAGYWGTPVQPAASSVTPAQGFTGLSGQSVETGIDVPNSFAAMASDSFDSLATGAPAVTTSSLGNALSGFNTAAQKPVDPVEAYAQQRRQPRNDLS